MTRLDRRQFGKAALAVAATITIAGTKSSGKVLGANDTVRVAIAGLNGRGSAHVGGYVSQKGVEIAYLVDPDKRTFSNGSRMLKAKQVRRLKLFKISAKHLLIKMWTLFPLQPPTTGIAS